jgi:hypothetical protein
MNKDTFLRVSKILIGDKDADVRDVELSINDPEKYITKNSRELSYRGIKKPNSMLPWIAVIDKLSERKQLVELDWKADASAFTEAISFLIRENRWAPHISDALKKATDPTIKKTRRILEAANDVLGEYDLIAVIIDINNDSFPLIVMQLVTWRNIVNLYDTEIKERLISYVAI